VVFGLGVATVLTLVLTPSLLALRVWFWTILGWMARAMARLGARRLSQRAQDWSLARAARRTRHPEILWEEPPQPAFVLDLPEDETPEAETPATPPESGPDGPPEDDGDSDTPLRAAE